jgi:YYY domain-containing protein
MLATFSWWLAVAVIGLVAFPFVFLFFPRLPDRGYAFTKVFGILIVGYVFWILGTAWVLPNTSGGIIWTLLMVAAAASIVVWRRQAELLAFVQRQWKLLLTIEGLFLLAFVIAAFLRSYVPEISGTEKPMDFAFLNASARSEHFPPNDPWLSGNSISYYYGGYFFVAMIGKLAAVKTSIGYNLGLAMTAALATVAVFGLVYNLVAIHHRRTTTGKSGKTPAPERNAPLLRRPLLFGLAAAVLLLVIGNLEGLLEFLAAHNVGSVAFWEWVDIKNLTAVSDNDKWYPSQHWWWWRAARVVSPDAPETITEFPFFSFLLGDLHPHVMSIPFVLLTMGAAVRLLQEPDTLDLSFWERHSWLLAGFAVLVGGLAFLNTWDFPTFLFLIIVVAAVRNYQALRRWDRRLLVATAGFAVPLTLASVLAYIPYHKAFIPQLGFASQAEGVAPVSGMATLPFHALIMWGPFAVIVIPFAVQRLAASIRRQPWRERDLLALVPAGAIVCFWLFANAAGGSLGDAVSERGSAWLTMLLLLGLLSLLLMTLLREVEALEGAGEGQMPLVASLVLSSLAVLLIIGPEFFFVKDVFGNRMNTVFKFYYQAWLLLAAGGGFALYYMVTRWVPLARLRFGWQGAWAAGAVVILASALLYPLGGTFSRTNDFDGERTLDGLAWAEKNYAEEYEAARWLETNADSSDVIIEMVGSSQLGYDYGPCGRISAWSGLSTILGWPGHENQWRGSYAPFEGRQQDVERLYSSDDPSEAWQIIAKYGIDYVYVGTLERQTYPEAALDKFATMLDEVYNPENGKVIIYRVTGTMLTEARP